MLAPDDVIAVEREVVANKNLSAERDADGELLIIAVPKSYRICVVTVWTLEGQQSEVPHTVFGDAVVFFHDLMSVVAKGLLGLVHKRIVWQGNMGRGSVRYCDFMQTCIVTLLSAPMEQQGHCILLMSGNLLTLLYITKALTACRDHDGRPCSKGAG